MATAAATATATATPILIPIEYCRPPHATRPTDELACLPEAPPADGRGTHHTQRGPRRPPLGRSELFATARSVAFHTAAIGQETTASPDTIRLVPPPPQGAPTRLVPAKTITNSVAVYVSRTHRRRPTDQHKTMNYMMVMRCVVRI